MKNCKLSQARGRKRPLFCISQKHALSFQFYSVVLKIFQALYKKKDIPSVKISKVFVVNFVSLNKHCSCIIVEKSSSSSLPSRINFMGMGKLRTRLEMIDRWVWKFFYFILPKYTILTLRITKGNSSIGIDTTWYNWYEMVYLSKRIVACHLSAHLYS